MADQNIYIGEQTTGNGTKVDPTRYVWFETNGSTYIADYLVSADSWSDIGLPMITGKIATVEDYTTQAVNAGIDVTSGFKTSDIFIGKDFHDSDAWASISTLAISIAAKTSNRPVVLDNETAIATFISNGVIEINYDAALAAISAQDWPEIWWWHGPIGTTEPTMSVTNDVAKAVMAGIPNAKIIEHNSAGYATSSETPGSQVNLAKTLLLDPDPVSIVYIDDVISHFWDLADTSEAISTAYGNAVIIYPGFGDLAMASSVKDTGSIMNPYESIDAINYPTGGDKSITDWITAGDDVYLWARRNGVFKKISKINAAGLSAMPTKSQAILRLGDGAFG